MADTTGTPVPTDSASQQKDTPSSSDELTKPTKNIQNFTLELPIKSRQSSNGDTEETAPAKSWGGWVELENHPVCLIIPTKIPTDSYR